MEDAMPLSPCRRICQLGPDDICTGCGRTIDEISRWISMTDAEKLDIMRRLEADSYGPQGEEGKFEPDSSTAPVERPATPGK